MNQNKFKVIRSILRYEDGTKDSLRGSFETSDLNTERERLKQEHNCEKVEFWFTDLSDRSKYKVKHGS